MAEIEIACIACNKPIQITEEKVIKCWDGEYVVCPNCHRAISIEQYWNRGCLNR